MVLLMEVRPRKIFGSRAVYLLHPTPKCERANGGAKGFEPEVTASTFTRCPTMNMRYFKTLDESDVSIQNSTVETVMPFSRFWTEEDLSMTCYLGW